MLRTADASADAVQVKVLLRTLFARCLNLAPAQIDDDSSFFSLGLTSLIHHEVLSLLSRFRTDLSSTVLFEHPNLALLSRHLAGPDAASTAAALEQALRDVSPAPDALAAGAAP
jgi:hypothetical protein